MSDESNELAMRAAMTLAEKVVAKAFELSVGSVNPKAFVIDVYDALVASGDIADGELRNFKHWLVSMHRRSLLTLGRCDTSPVFDPEKVKASVVRYMGMEFHFIRGWFCDSRLRLSEGSEDRSGSTI